MGYHFGDGRTATANCSTRFVKNSRRNTSVYPAYPLCAISHYCQDHLVRCWATKLNSLTLGCVRLRRNVPTSSICRLISPWIRQKWRLMVFTPVQKFTGNGHIAPLTYSSRLWPKGLHSHDLQSTRFPLKLTLWMVFLRAV